MGTGFFPFLSFPRPWMPVLGFTKDEDGRKDGCYVTGRKGKKGSLCRVVVHWSTVHAAESWTRDGWFFCLPPASPVQYMTPPSTLLSTKFWALFCCCCCYLLPVCLSAGEERGLSKRNSTSVWIIYSCLLLPHTLGGSFGRADILSFLVSHSNLVFKHPGLTG